MLSMHQLFRDTYTLCRTILKVYVLDACTLASMSNVVMCAVWASEIVDAIIGHVCVQSLIFDVLILQFMSRVRIIEKAEQFDLHYQYYYYHRHQ